MGSREGLEGVCRGSTEGSTGLLQGVSKGVYLPVELSELVPVVLHQRRSFVRHLLVVHRLGRLQGRARPGGPPPSPLVHPPPAGRTSPASRAVRASARPWTHPQIGLAALSLPEMNKQRHREVKENGGSPKDANKNRVVQ
eukprot:1182443-Prorocentrum_minimum.AAC.8